MLPVTFEGSREIQKPDVMTDEECSSLPIIQGVHEDGYPYTISKWMPSKEDIEAIQAGRGIWVRVLSHMVFPMSLVTFNENGEVNQ